MGDDLVLRHPPEFLLRAKYAYDFVRQKHVGRSGTSGLKKSHEIGTEQPREKGKSLNGRHALALSCSSERSLGFGRVEDSHLELATANREPHVQVPAADFSVLPTSTPILVLFELKLPRNK